MLKGLPASGKTTWAKEFILSQPANSWKRVNKDELRQMLDIGRWSKGNEEMVKSIRDNVVAEALRMGCHVIVDDTNLDPKHERRLRELAKEFGAGFEVITFNSPLEKCLERDAARPNPVGEKVIRDMWNRYLAPEEARGTSLHWDLDPELPSAVICDLDGTLADIGSRSPYDASTCSLDRVNDPVHYVLSALGRDNKKLSLIFMSGREEKYRAETLAWLTANTALLLDSYKMVYLFMRPTGDNRKDSIIKKELFEQHVAGKFNTLLVLDDRDQVVEMWRKELGLPCFQVNYGNF